MVDRVQELGGEILRLCLQAGGSITGEHGVGSDKRCYLDWMFEPDDPATVAWWSRPLHAAAWPIPARSFPTPRSCGESARLQEVVPELVEVEVF